MNTEVTTVSIGMTAAIGGLFWVMPLLRRPSLLFGYRVSPEWASGPGARRIIRTYQAQIALWMGMEVLAAWIGYPQIGPVMMVVGGAAAFVIAHGGTRSHAIEPSAMRAASLSSDREGLPGGVAGAVFPYLILAGAALWMNLHWAQIPETFPIHFNLAGVPDGWAHRTFSGVYGPPIFGALIVTLILILALGILLGSPRGGVGTGRFRQANIRALVGLTWAIALLFSGITVSSISPLRRFLGILVAAFLCLVFALLWPLIRIASAVGADVDSTPDAAWKLGMIYYNPGDPALMVQRRFGIGYTLNFGNRISWALLMLIGAIPLCMFALRKGM